MKIVFHSMFIAILILGSPFATAFGQSDFDLKKMSLHFIENRGQVHDEVAYYIKGADKSLFFKPEGITFALKGKQTVDLAFVNANPGVVPKGKEKQKAIFSYYKGKPEEWITAVPTFSKLVYPELWPGIDLVYSGSVGLLKYEFIVKPGSDPKKVRLAYSGVTNLKVKETGALRIEAHGIDFEDGKPIAYQWVDEVKREISMQYAIEKQEQGDFSVTFHVGSYDPEKPLILDPALIVYCGFIGGDHIDHGKGIALDGKGNIYVTGLTASDEITFPVKNGPDLTYNGKWDTYIAKVNASGTSLEYCGFIGGQENDYGDNIAVDGKGCAYVTGYTESNEKTFPVKIGPDLTYNGTYDAFVAKVDADGSSLDFCGYIGGQDLDLGYGVAVDHKGCAYLTGYTSSDESSFPVTIGPDLTYNDSYDAFVTKVAADGASLVYCGYLGGDSNDEGIAIAVDNLGAAYLTGRTGSKETTFPIKSGPDKVFNGQFDAFVAKVIPAGTDLAYCGYIGGSKDDTGHDIAVDGLGCAYVIGDTQSSPPTFPVKVGPDLSFNGGAFDAFVAKVETDGEHLGFCGYIGGEFNDWGEGIAADEDGNIYFTGTAGSDHKTFPVKIGPSLNANASYNAYVAKITQGLWCDQHSLSAATGGTVDFSLYGGKDSAKQVYLLLGSMSGTEPGIPLPNGGMLPLKWDAFTGLVYAFVNTSVFSNFMATLDSTGQSTAQLNAVRPLPASAIGTLIYFAYAADTLPESFASNPVVIEIVP